MGKRVTTDGGLTIRLDLRDRFTEGRVRDGSGEVVEAFRVRATEAALSVRLATVSAEPTGARGRDPLALGEPSRDTTWPRGDRREPAAGATDRRERLEERRRRCGAAGSAGTSRSLAAEAHRAPG